MEKRSTKQTIQALDTYMFKIADMIGSDDGVFTNGITIEDYEKLYHFSCALYTVHNQTHGEHLTKDMFSEAVLTFYASMFDKGLFENNEEIYTRAEKAFPSINEFLDIYLEYLKERKTNPSDSLMHFVSAVMKRIPSCSHLGAFSIEGVSFSTKLSTIVEMMASDYTDLVSEWDKSLDHPASDDFIVETYPAVKETTQATTSKKRNMPLIVVAVLLVCSLIGNIFQFNNNSALNTEIMTLNRELSGLNTLYEYKKEDAKTYYTKYLQMKDAYNFYDKHAVIVSEYNNKYHKYDCELWDYPIWIYNIETAKGKGHTPCSRCFPD